MIPPELHDIELFYWQAFWDLCTERQVTMGGAMPIPLSAIRKYEEDNGCHGREFIDIMRKMDAAYLNAKDEKSKPHPNEMKART